MLQLLLPELPLKTAVRIAADITGNARNALYPLALALKREMDEGEDEDTDSAADDGGDESHRR